MHWYQVVKLQYQGNMSPAVFDNYVVDLVNFLTFVADPVLMSVLAGHRAGLSFAGGAIGFFAY